jgi:hypothetical protein
VNRLLLWITTAVLGMAGSLMTSFGLIPALLFLVLMLPLLLRGDRVVASSGLLTGFGAAWTALMARQAATGGTTDNQGFWLAVGFVPLVSGCALLALFVVRGAGAGGAARR